MSWDLDMFTYYQDNLQEYQLQLDILNKKLENNTQYIKQLNNSIIECSICLDRFPNILYFPCKHITNCSICSKNIKKCPLCLVIIENKMEIFYG